MKLLSQNSNTQQIDNLFPNWTNFVVLVLTFVDIRHANLAV